MLKKILMTSLLSCATLTAIAAPTTHSPKQCTVTIVVSSNWKHYNITFKTERGTPMGLYRSNGPLIIKSEHPCISNVSQHIYANPTPGLVAMPNYLGYVSAISYPMDQSILVSFPNDFPGAPITPHGQSKK